jgi:hypothetical protein
VAKVCSAGHPALDQRQEGLQPAQRHLLLGGLLRLQHPTAQQSLDALRVAGVQPALHAAHRLVQATLDRLAVDVDAAGVGVHGVGQLLAQPWHVREQALVGGLAQGQEQPHLVLGPVQALAERGDVLRHEHAGALRPERQADVGAGGDLVGQLGQRLADLGAEHDAAHLAHDPGERPGDGRGLLRQGAGHRGDHTLGERVDQRGPGGQGLLHPVDPRPGQAAVDARGQLGHLVEPQVGQPQRLGDGGLLGGRRRLVARGQLADRALPGEVPVHRAARPAHQLLQLREQRHLAQQLGGITAARAHAAADRPEQRAQAEGIVRIAALTALAPLLGVAVGEPEAEGKIAHGPTVDARDPADRRPTGRSA